MISLIICSRNPSISPALAANIASTIGVPYELVVIDNSANNHSIFEAYNIGVSRSKYPYLCFMHDDIEYHTNNWGKNVLSHFEDEQTGAIGVAGSPYFPQMPAAWWTSGLVSENILQSNKTSMPPVLKKRGQGTGPKQVVVLDGVWLCIKKILFDQIKFDEEIFENYHFYDADICLQIHQFGYKLFCVFDILIHHLSHGHLDSKWTNDAIKLHKKWHAKLPASCIPLGYIQRSKIEFKALSEYILVLQQNGFSKKASHRWAFFKALTFYKGYLFYKTPAYILKYLLKSI